MAFELPIGTRVQFNLLNAKAEDFGLEGISPGQLRRLEGGEAHITGQAVCNTFDDDVPDKDYDYYDIQFDHNGLVLHGVSGEHLKPIAPLLSKPVESKPSAIDRLTEGSSKAAVELSEPIMLNVRYRTSVSAGYHTGGSRGQWFDQVTMWIDLVAEDSDGQRLTFLEATAFSCPSVEEIEAELADSLKFHFVGMTFGNALKNLAIKLHAALKPASEQLSSLPKPE